jgi:hypothetical protein
MSRTSVLRNVLMLGAVSSLVALTVTATVVGASSIAAPKHVRATGTATSILVSWTRPPGAPVKKYIVTSKPSGRSCVTAATRCTVKGLHRGVKYSFRVVARSATGTSAPSSPSNHVKVATAGVYFSTRLSVGSGLIAKYETDLDNVTAAKAQPFLAKLSGAFASLTKSLTIEVWPRSARSDMTSFVSTFRTLGSDTVEDFSASSGLAKATYALQSVTNKEILVEAKVRTDLSLPQRIITPIDQTPTPVSLGTPQTVHDFYDDPFSVTVGQVFDPATAASGSGQPDSGDRLVAVQMNIANNGTEEISDDANFATTITGTDGQEYTADFNAVTQCTNFASGYGFFDVPSGGTASGCVVFELPSAVGVQSISFSLAQGYLDTAEWTN